MQEIKVCPFRIHKEKKLSATVKGEYFENEWFMKCIKKECPAYYVGFTEVVGGSGKYPAERCKRLEYGK